MGRLHSRQTGPVPDPWARLQPGQVVHHAGTLASEIGPLVPKRTRTACSGFSEEAATISQVALFGQWNVFASAEPVAVHTVNHSSCEDDQ